MDYMQKEYNKELAKTKIQKPQPSETTAETDKPDIREEKRVPKTKFKQFHMVYFDNNGNETIGKPRSKSRKKVSKEGYPVVVEDIGEYYDDDKLTIPKRRNYRVEYFINNLVSQIDFNYVNYSYQPFTGGAGPIYQFAGFQLNFQVGVTDLMEDRRLVGGVRLDSICSSLTASSVAEEASSLSHSDLQTMCHSLFSRQPSSFTCGIRPATSFWSMSVIQNTHTWTVPSTFPSQ